MCQPEVKSDPNRQVGWYTAVLLLDIVDHSMDLHLGPWTIAHAATALVQCSDLVVQVSKAISKPDQVKETRATLAVCRETGRHVAASPIVIRQIVW